MASLGPIYVRDLRMGDVIPEDVWEEIVAQVGDLVLGRPKTRTVAGEIRVELCIDQATMARVRAIAREHGPTPWELDPDWWKADR